MTWSVSIPGQPPSANSMYERNSWNLGQHKKAGIETYQATVTHLVRQSKPRDWRDYLNGFVIIEYRFTLRREVDCTNAIKIIEDGIAMALCEGRDPPRCCHEYDSRFLPRAMFKVVHSGLIPFVGLTIIPER